MGVSFPFLYKSFLFFRPQQHHLLKLHYLQLARILAPPGFTSNVFHFMNSMEVFYVAGAFGEVWLRGLFGSLVA